MVKSIIAVLALACAGSARWTADHQYTPGDSATIANQIKQKLLSNSNLFVDTQFRDQLVNDLNNSDDSKRSLKEISALSANQLFTVLGLYDPGCDKDNNGVIKGDELKCLNFAWKSFIPQ